MQLPFFKSLIIQLPTFLLFFVSISTAQERYLHFNEVDGLPRNITTCLEQDQYGYVWIGTTNGIARYDGKDFYSYNELSGISVISLLYDSRNTLWASSGNGLLNPSGLKKHTILSGRADSGFLRPPIKQDLAIQIILRSVLKKSLAKIHHKLKLPLKNQTITPFLTMYKTHQSLKYH